MEPDLAPVSGGLRRSRLRDKLVYRLLVRCASFRHPTLQAWWSRAWARATPTMSGSVRVRIHGQRALVNAGYAYPAFYRMWRTYNDPLVELVHQTARSQARPVRVVDVGAAVGDTALLLLERCAQDVRHVHCIEPDPEFLQYLSHNVGERPDVLVSGAMLSDNIESVPDLVRTHSGTASAVGRSTRIATTLDELLDEQTSVDVLKTDTDGFDGRVLAGSREVLRRDEPSVIFEWHPLLYQRAGQDLMLPFSVLEEAGYSTMLWFTKEGEFSHLTTRRDERALASLADLCLTGRGPRPDWHYDVVALPKRLEAAKEAVAALHYARESRR